MKKFYTYDEQIEKMISDGLIIENRDEVLSSLSDIGYYRLIKGYYGLFVDRSGSKQTGGHVKYKENTRFENIKALYDFDFELRNTIYKRMSTIETLIKSVVSYVFSKHHGIDHNLYLKESCFNANNKNKAEIARLIETCNDTIAETSNANSGFYRVYIAHALETYAQVPVWAMFMVLTFGNVSKFYQLMIPEEKAEIASFFNVSDLELENILKIIVKFRNIVFHHERLYNARLPKERLSQKLKVAKSLSIPKNKSGENKYGRNDFLSLLIAMKYLLKQLDFAGLIEELDLLFEQLEKRTSESCVKAVKTEMRIAKVNLDTLVKIKV
ncbi:MAG TPA: hypothetical protein DIC18_01705 [Clostridiales bacterium]|nr:hypothetical protein [Clostridiales bacterium]